MNIAGIQSLDSNIANEKISMPYPHVKVLDVSDVIALIVPILEPGDLPILCEFENVTRQIGSVRKSALVLHTLRRVTRIEYHKSKDICVEVDDMSKLLEVL